MSGLFSKPVPLPVVALVFLILAHFGASAMAYNAMLDLFTKGMPIEPWPVHGDAILKLSNVFLYPVSGASTRQKSFPRGLPDPGSMFLNSLLTGSTVWAAGFLTWQLWRQSRRKLARPPS
jgi:hypothetical protein